MAKATESSRKDVVIVGAGMAGMTAAIEARSRGAHVIVTEKFSDVTRSSTSLAGGGFDVQAQPYGRYSKEELTEAFLKTSSGLCDRSLVETFAGRLAGDFQWLKDELGLPLAPNLMRKGGFSAIGKGAGIPPFLENKAREKGVEFHFNTKARRLLTDRHERVVGLEATTPERSYGRGRIYGIAVDSQNNVYWGDIGAGNIGLNDLGAAPNDHRRNLRPIIDVFLA